MRLRDHLCGEFPFEVVVTRRHERARSPRPTCSAPSLPCALERIREAPLDVV